MNKKTFYNFIIITVLAFSYVGAEGVQNKDEPKVSIHAEDTHLPTILSMLAKQSEYNIVTGPNVQTQEKLKACRP